MHMVENNMDKGQAKSKLHVKFQIVFFFIFFPEQRWKKIATS